MAIKVDNVGKCEEIGTLSNSENSDRSLIVWTSLHAKEEPNAWVIDSGFSNHMNGDRRKLINLEKWNGGSVKFGGEEATQVFGKETITIDGKDKTKDVLYVKGLRYNLLSVS